jgi:Protein of unknown function (DUF2631)
VLGVVVIAAIVPVLCDDVPPSEPVRQDGGAVATSSRRTARRGGVGPHDEPSAEWGWHGSFPNGLRISGVIVAIVLLVLLIGPYQDRLQDFWMIPIALGILALIVWGTVKRRRNDWRK